MACLLFKALNGRFPYTGVRACHIPLAGRFLAVRCDEEKGMTLDELADNEDGTTFVAVRREHPHDLPLFFKTFPL